MRPSMLDALLDVDGLCAAERRATVQEIRNALDPYSNDPVRLTRVIDSILDDVASRPVGTKKRQRAEGLADHSLASVPVKRSYSIRGQR